MNQVVPMQDAAQPKSVLISMASRFGMEPHAFEATLRATVVPPQSTKEQFAAFLLVANEYHLNPLTKEIYAFPTRAGGIQPIVSIDGWMNLVNSHPKSDGMEFEDVFGDDGKLKAITCRMFRKDRSHPTVVTEYMSECVRPTDTWKQWPARMLRHKAAIQCARYAFGFSGIMDEDEYDRLQSAHQVAPSTLPVPLAAPPEQSPEELVAFMLTAIDGMTDIGKLNDWTKRHKAAFTRLSDEQQAHVREMADHKRGFLAQAPPAEPHDADTGEIIEGEPFDPAEWLNELDTIMTGASDAGDLEKAWLDYATPNKGAVSAENWRKAEQTLERHSMRLGL